MSRDSVYGFTRSVHERAERLVASEILCNDSGFVPLLIREKFAGQFGLDRIANLFDDSVEAMEEFLIEEGCLPENWNELDDAGKGLVAGRFEFSPVLKDILEWWRVSDALARHLVRSGEPVLRNDFGAWWGRTSSGQEILMDGTIQRLLSTGSSDDRRGNGVPCFRLGLQSPDGPGRSTVNETVFRE
ncbi:MAG: hypothetical protein CMO55_17000 [Verrucomicrobiales bacterium]|nr:hypothetical protein [Verrucomicrobiales bacterium]